MPTLSGPALFGTDPGLLVAGEEIPASYLDAFGARHPVDVDRLKALGLVDDDDDQAADEDQAADDGYEGRTKAELEDEARVRGIVVEGTGAGGGVVKADLVRALNADDE